jgi:manganese/zinc/iron transport system permease protein
MAGTALLAASAGVVGSFAVLRRQSLQGDVVAHAALAGVAAAFLLGVRGPLGLLLGGAVTGWITLILASRLHQNTRLPLDAVQGGIMAMTFGLGLALLKHILTHVPDAGRHPLDRYLLGQAAQLRDADVQIIAAVTILTVLVVIAFWSQWKLLAFDPEYAAGLGLPVRLLDLGLTTLTVTVVVIGLKSVGVVLITALLVAPAVAARQWTNRLGIMVLLAGFFGALSGILGTLLAHLLGRHVSIPTGPTIVLCASGWVILSLLAVGIRQRCYRWIVNRRSHYA